MNKYFNSKYLVLLFALIFLVVHYYSRTVIYNNWTNVMGWDVLSYYLYLPFAFIYHDPGMTDQSVIQHIFETYNPSGTFYQAWQLPNGNWLPMYTCGMAFLFMPFFFIGHLWALIGNYPADGFSFPYQFCIGNGVMIYIIAGIFFIRKVLLEFFTDKVTMIVLALLMLGTNYFHEAAIDEVMPHAMLFTAYAIILWLTIVWHKKPTKKNSFLLGLVMGFTILARGSEILVVLIPLLWNVYDKASLKEKIKFLKANSKYFILVIIAALIFPLIQMIYWKIIAGTFIVNSYQNTEGFDWFSPHIKKVLFSYKKSWFLYTPMIILPIIGIFLMRKNLKNIFLPIAIFFILNLYFLCAWAAWWQGGSFGMRYFVESYAVMAIPFGVFIAYISRRNLLIKLMVGLIAVFFLFLNLFQTWQFNNWILDGYAMTKDYYWKVFLKTSVSEEDKKLKEIIREFKTTETFSNPQDYYRKTICYMDFDSINTVTVVPDFIDTAHYLSPPHSCRLTKDYIYSPTFTMPFNIITKKEHAWIKVTLYYYPVYDLKDNPATVVIHLRHKNRFTFGYKSVDLEKQAYKLNQWNKISFDYLTPYPLSEDDMLYAYVWLRGDKDFYFDNMHLEAFERKW